MQDDSIVAASLSIKTNATCARTLVASVVSMSGGATTMQDDTVTTANLSVGAIYGGVDNAGATTAALAVTDASTIAVDNNVRIQRVKPGASATAVVLATAANEGRDLTILNVGSVIVSLAATNLSGGAQTIATSNGASFVYDLGLTKWFRRL